MARRLVSVSSRTGGASASVGLLPPVQTARLDASLFSNTGGARTAISQYDANNFVYAAWGSDTTTNTIKITAQGITVSENGTISLSSVATATNTSGTVLGQTMMGDAQGGHVACCTNSYLSTSSGAISIYQAQFDGTTVSVNRAGNSPVTTTYQVPSSGNPFRSGDLSGTRYTVHTGWGTSNYGGFTIWANNAFSTGGALNGYSSTSGCLGSLQAYTRPTGYGGFGYDHRAANNGYYWSFYHSGNSRSNMGYSYAILEDYYQTQPNDTCGFKWCAANTADDRHILVNKRGNGFAMAPNGVSVGALTSNCPIDADFNINYNGHGSFAVANNLFFLPTSNGFGGFYSLEYDQQNSRAEFTNVGNLLFPGARNFYTPSKQSSTGGALMRIAGSGGQFALTVDGPEVYVRDISEVVDLSSYY